MNEKALVDREKVAELCSAADELVEAVEQMENPFTAMREWLADGMPDPDKWWAEREAESETR